MSSTMSTVYFPKEKDQDETGEDRISALPDDIIIRLILARLSIEDAVRTSILSRRWRYLPTELTTLEFVASKTLEEQYENWNEFLDTETSKYKNWVNQVLSLHRSPSINEFRVCFPLDDNHTSDIDRWLEFAISRNVQKLELDFRGKHIRAFSPLYALRECDDVLDMFCIDSKVNSLRSLTLKYVDVTGESLELLVSQLHFLERLVVEKSYELVTLKLRSSSSRLKHLTIRDCSRLRELELDVMDLISFELNCDKCYNMATLVHKRVSSLLKFTVPGRLMGPENSNYIQETSDPHTSGWKVFKGLPRESAISSLKSLTLVGVNIGGELLEHFLSQFHYLERLVVEGSDNLVKLKITRSSSRLKHVCISKCKNMKELEVDLQDLMFFKLRRLSTEVNLMPNNGDSSFLKFMTLSDEWTTLMFDIDYIKGI